MAIIGIDAHVLGKNIGGVERYVHHLVKMVPALTPNHEFVVFVTREAHFSTTALGLADLPPNVRIVPLPISDPLIQRTVVLPYLAWKHRLDVIHVQRIAPWILGKCRIVLTVHDLTPLKYVSTYRGIRNTMVRLFTRASVLRAHLVITPTQTIADEIRRFFPDCRAPIRVYYNGVDTDIFCLGQGEANALNAIEHLGITAPYVFISGAAESRKNLETAYRAISLLGNEAPTLVLAGSTRDTHYAEKLFKLAAELTIEGKIIRLGFVSDGDLAKLYRHATAFLAPSLDEGFNMPPLEAMACGSPVICSDIPVHRELFNGAAVFFSPTSAEGLATSIASLAKDGPKRGAMIEAGQTIPPRYTWAGMAHRMSAFYQELLD
jgi:alpha-1,3-rhamnosyl/mannosyltransferase